MDQNSISFLRDSLNHHHSLRSGLDQKASKPKTLILKWASFILILGLLAGFVLFFV